MLEKVTIQPSKEETKEVFAPTNTHPRGCDDPFCHVCSMNSIEYANPHCPQCKGGGFVHPVDVAGNPIGRELVSCNMKGCMKENWASRESFRPTTNKQYKFKAPVQTFDNFVTFRLNGSEMKKVKVLEDFKSKMINFCEGETKPIVLIYGSTGTGKTHILNAVLSKMLFKDDASRYFNASDLFNWLKQGFDDKLDPYENRRQFVRDLYCLLIDDIKAERMSEWEWEQLENLFDYRTRERILPTVFVTNNDKNDMSFRLIDRFTDNSFCEVIKLDLESYRGLKK